MFASRIAALLKLAFRNWRQLFLFVDFGETSITATAGVWNCSSRVRALVVHHFTRKLLRAVFGLIMRKLREIAFLSNNLPVDYTVTFLTLGQHLCVKTSSIKCVLFCHLFFWIVMFWFKPASRKSAFVELTSFKSLFLVNFQISTSKFRKTFLQKRLGKTRCFKCKICSMLFSANIAVEQGVIVTVFMIALFIFTFSRCTKTRVQSNPSSEFAPRHRLPK